MRLLYPSPSSYTQTARVAFFAGAGRSRLEITRINHSYVFTNKFLPTVSNENTTTDNPPSHNRKSYSALPEEVAIPFLSFIHSEDHARRRFEIKIDASERMQASSVRIEMRFVFHGAMEKLR